MNKLKKIFTIFLFFCFIFILFKYNFTLNKSVITAASLWLNKVFPSLFIMFILNNIIISTHALDTFSQIFNPWFNKIFNTSGNSCQAFLLSLFSGTPTSAFILKEMIHNNTITEEDANKLIGFTYFANPLFLYNILSLSFNTYIVFKIIIFHYLANIIIGLIFRGKEKNISNCPTNKNKIEKKKILSIIPNAIQKSLNTLLMILGTITFFMIITNFLMAIFKLNILSEVIIKGILEITQSLHILNKLNTISIIKEIIALSIISFGGLSIHTQIISILEETNIKYQNFLKARVIHVLISATSYILFYFLSSS